MVFQEVLEIRTKQQSLRCTVTCTKVTTIHSPFYCLPREIRTSNNTQGRIINKFYLRDRGSFWERRFVKSLDTFETFGTFQETFKFVKPIKSFGISVDPPENYPRFVVIFQMVSLARTWNQIVINQLTTRVLIFKRRSDLEISNCSKNVTVSIE